MIIRKRENLEAGMDLLTRRLLASWDFRIPLEITYQAAVDHLTMSQRKQFHALCGDIAEHFTAKGHPITQEKVKLLMKYKFLGTEEHTIGKTKIPPQVRSTESLSKGEYSHLISEVMDWAMDHGVEKITNPATGEYMKLRREAVS